MSLCVGKKEGRRWQGLGEEPFLNHKSTVQVRGSCKSNK